MFRGTYTPNTNSSYASSLSNPTWGGPSAATVSVGRPTGISKPKDNSFAANIGNPVWSGPTTAATSGQIANPTPQNVGPNNPVVVPAKLSPNRGKNFRGDPRAILQAILLNRGNPYRTSSLNEEELRNTAMSRLRG